MSSRRRPTRRSAQTVSYKDADFSGSGSGSGSESDPDQYADLNSQRQRRARGRVSYREQSSSSEDDSDSIAFADRQQVKNPASVSSGRQPSRFSERQRATHATKRTSYLEKASSSSSEIEYSVNSNRTKSNAASSTPNRQSRKRKRSVASGPSSRRADLERRNKTAATEVLSDGKIPPWERLPYHVLLAIFQYASYPLHDDNFQPLQSLNWLITAARICKSFSEPALVTLYDCPPLLRRDHVSGLLGLLQSEEGYIDYGRKVKHLRIHQKLCRYSSNSKDEMHIPSLIKLLPQLKEVDVTNTCHTPYTHPMVSLRNWHFPLSILEVLHEQSVQLTGWQWNASAMPKLFDAFYQEHSTQLFQSIERLTLRFLQLESDPVSNRNVGARLTIRDLEPLKNLHDLSLVVCHSSDWDLLGVMPHQLRSLNISACTGFTSTHLSQYLERSGKCLTNLELSHNNCLDLQWLENLRSYSPLLESLRMDLTYFSTTLTTRNEDSEPMYDQLLLPGVVPTWPSRLRNIEFFHLRKWSLEAAETFLLSLVQAAPELNELRYITIKAMLDIGWRDRAKLRDAWINRFQKVFLRRSQSPSRHLASLRAYREWKLRNENGARLSEATVQLRSTTSTRATRSKATPEPETETPIQGLCERVEINIDNLRPKEVQFNEQDFVGEELSGDEDWTGNNLELDDGGGYAW